MELEEPGSLISDYTTKLQSSKQYGTGAHTHTHTHTKYIYIDQWKRTKKKKP